MGNTAGYSGTPLARKLGIKRDFHILLVNEPKYYLDLFEELPDGILFSDKPKENTTDFIHFFCTAWDNLVEEAPMYIKALKKTGMLWISWPKGSSKIPTDLKRDAIREYLLALGLVDTKVAAIDEDWSGLKFVYRLKDR